MCGDIGYVVAIRICSKCKITRKHAYCMEGVYEGDPEKWVCEECDSANHIPLSKPAPSNKPSGTAMRFMIKKPPRIPRVQYISPQEAMALESGAPRKIPSSHRPPMNKPVVARRDGNQSTALPPKIKSSCSHDKKLSEKEKPSIQKQQARVESLVGIRSSARKTETSNATVQKEKDKRPARQLCRGSLADISLSCGELPEVNVERENINLGSIPRQLVQCLLAVRSGVEGREASSKMELDKYLPNHPAESPIWKGKFEMEDDAYSGYVDGIQAHPPCKVHKKVFKLSKQLPETLKFELLPRSNFWVDMFEDDVPGGLDIGLYFFPSERHEQSYASLLEHMDGHDLLLRSYIDGVELLVFSSKHLQEDSQRINQKHFLWGLFRNNIVSSMATLLAQNSQIRNTSMTSFGVQALSRNDTIHPSDDTHIQLGEVQRSASEEHEAEDMDIDMLGGHDVGAVDVRVPKSSERILSKERSNEIRASPNGSTNAALEFSPSRVKRESSLPLTTCLEAELEFERELQRSFDRFTMLMQLKETGCLKMEVKEEKWEPWSS